MNRSNPPARPRATLCLLLLCAAIGAGGCVYRPNIQQGNLVEITDVDQVTPGMTRSQVRYLLGTPMISDPFDPQRWDYVYMFTRGREKRSDRAHFTVRFEGDKVVSVDKLALPEVQVAEGSGRGATTEADATREPPAPPSIKQPQPDAPRPGGNGG